MAIEQDKILLNNIQHLTEKNPFAWKKTSSSSCFLYPLSKGAINFCDYLNADNKNIIAITLLDGLGNIVTTVNVNSETQSELYKEFYSFYDEIKKNISQYEIGRFNKSLEIVSGSINS